MFTEQAPELMEARLAGPTDIAGFRSEAQHLLAHQVPPERVRWCTEEPDSRVAGLTAAQAPKAAVRAASSIVPASFVRLCDYVAQHRDPDRFELLYRLLWRLVHEPALRHDPTDPDVARAQHMAHAVRRDIHKIKAGVRFRVLPDPLRAGEIIHLAWCDPAHHVVDTVAGWLARQYAGIRWALFTPERSVQWDGTQLLSCRGSRPALSATAPDEEWLARWRAVFGDAP